MKLDYDDLLEKANTQCIDYLVQDGRLDADDLKYKAPEQLAPIRSTQVRAILKVLVDALNEE